MPYKGRGDGPLRCLSSVEPVHGVRSAQRGTKAVIIHGDIPPQAGLSRSNQIRALPSRTLASKDRRIGAFESIRVSGLGKALGLKIFGLSRFGYTLYSVHRDQPGFSLTRKSNGLSRL